MQYISIVSADARWSISMGLSGISVQQRFVAQQYVPHVCVYTESFLTIFMVITFFNFILVTVNLVFEKFDIF